MNTKLEILFFASNPEDVTNLSLDEELHSILEKLRASGHGEVFDLVSRWATRPDDLLQELNVLKPVIVHFSGHGSKAGELVLMNDLRLAKTVSPSALKALFSTLKDNIRLVVLNACYSKTQATAIADVIDCVVGMNASIGDQAAISFAASFYRALGSGRSVKEAFDQGKVSLMLEGIPEENTPELLFREGVDPASVYFVSTQQDKPDIIERKEIVLSPTCTRLLETLKDADEHLRYSADEIAEFLNININDVKDDLETLIEEGMIGRDNEYKYYRLAEGRKYLRKK